MSTRLHQELCQLLASAKNAKDIEAILSELLTPAECKAIDERWQIVQLLLQGRSQRDIRDTLKIAIATVSRGARVVKYGKGILRKHYEKLQRA